jgi:hypothetical protein
VTLVFLLSTTTTTTLAALTDDMLPPNATALPVINLQLVCATDTRQHGTEVHVDDAHVYSHVPPPWNATQVFSDYYASLHLGIDKPLFVYSEKVDGMDSLRETHPDLSPTVCNLTSPMTMLTLLMEGYYYSNNNNNNDNHSQR